MTNADARVMEIGLATPIKLSKHEIRTALLRNHGFVAAAAKELGVSRQTLARRLADDPKLGETPEDVEAELRDRCLAGIIQRVQQRHGPTIRWYLDNFGMERGYGARRSTSAPLPSNDARAELKAWIASATASERRHRPSQPGEARGDALSRLRLAISDAPAGTRQSRRTRKLSGSDCRPDV